MIISAKNLRSFSAMLRAGGEEYTKFVLKNGEWVFDRSRSGAKIEGKENDESSKNGIRRMPFSKKQRTEMQFVFDEFSVEVFVDGKSLTSQIFPSIDSDGAYFTIDADEYEYIKKSV